MVKKIITLFVSIFLILALSISVAAVNDLGKTISLSDAISNELNTTDPFLVTITRPDVEKENTFKKNYVIGGTSEVKDLVLVIARYNDKTGSYEEFSTTDGDSRWSIGKSKFFAKELALERGTNSFKLIAFKKADSEKLVSDKNLQVSYFTIVLLDESLKDKIINGLFSIFNKLPITILDSSK